jgi:hypothetical protein
VNDQEDEMNSKVGPARGDGGGNRRRGGRLAAVLVCLAVSAAAFGMAGCSANPGPGNGTSDSGLTFALCMRAHGVHNFPDPSADGAVNLSGINQNSPQFQHAAGICGRPANAGPAQEAEGLAKGVEFARCMRAHGVVNYADPTVSNSGNGSSISTHTSSGSGMDPESPVFKAAARACRSLRP